MFNTMTIVKTAAAFIGSLLVLILATWAASGIYHVGPSGHVAEGEAPHQAYTIPVPETAAGGGAAEEEGPNFATLMASADPAAGEKVFSKCKSCHKLDGSNGIGPHLDGVVGRAIASVGDYNYDAAMKEHAAEVPDWTPEALQEFLINPKKVVPGTKMTFPGLPKGADRANLIAYLEQN